MSTPVSTKATRPGDHDPVGAPDLLLRLFADGRPHTRAEVIAGTGHARSTVNQRLHALEASGFLVRHDQAPSTGGRRADSFALNPDARSILAIDIGPNHARVALLDMTLGILDERSERFDTTREPVGVLDHVIELADELRASATYPGLAGVGLSLPTPLDPDTGRPVRPPLMPGWDGFDVCGHLQDWAQVPVTVERENFAVALAEQAADGGATANMLVVSVSTWIGAGTIVNGQLARGERGEAGHIGHIVGPWPERDACACGNFGCLEAVAGGHALVRHIGEKVGASTTLELAELAAGGEPLVLAAIREAGRKIGLAVAAYVSILNPARVVLRGSLAQAGFELLNGVRETLYGQAFSIAAQDVSVSIGQTGDQAPILGVGTLALDHFFAEGDSL